LHLGYCFPKLSVGQLLTRIPAEHILVKDLDIDPLLQFWGQIVLDLCQLKLFGSFTVHCGEAELGILNRAVAVGPIFLEEAVFGELDSVIRGKAPREVGVVDNPKVIRVDSCCLLHFIVTRELAKAFDVLLL
jgi:hypothetical protein